MKEKNFDLSVWRVAAMIPRGKVSTYGEIAKALRNPKAARAVGNALNRSPGLRRREFSAGRGTADRQKSAMLTQAVPCYRVVRSNGSVGGYAKGAKRKEAILRADGIPVKNGKIPNFRTYLFKFPRR